MTTPQSHNLTLQSAQGTASETPVQRNWTLSLAALTRRTRVLVAEDDAAMRRLLVSSLGNDGYEVVEASDGRTLLALVRASDCDPRGQFALIVSDVRMPGHSGMDVLARMRSDHSSMPIILITAFGDESLHEEARQLGAFAVFDKPLQLDELRAAVSRLAKKHG